MFKNNNNNNNIIFNLVQGDRRKARVRKFRNF